MRINHSLPQTVAITFARRILTFHRVSEGEFDTRGFEGLIIQLKQILQGIFINFILKSIQGQIVWSSSAGLLHVKFNGKKSALRWLKAFDSEWTSWRAMNNQDPPPSILLNTLDMLLDKTASQ